jgi:acyl-CoA thioester hydrolase
MERFAPDFLDSAQYHFWYEDDVRYRDLDILGHVNNGAAVQYFADARVKLFYQVLPEWPKVPGVFVIVNQRFEYFAELYYPNRIRVGLKPIKTGTSSLNVGGILCCGEKIIVASEALSVYIDSVTRRPAPIPEALKEDLAKSLRG